MSPIPGHSAQPVERIGIVRLGCFENGELHVTEQRVVPANQREIDVDALLHCGIGKPLGDFRSPLNPTVLSIER